MKNFLSAAKLILTLKCEQSTRIVSDSLDRELTSVERWAVRLHYIACSSCRRFGKQLRELRNTLNFHPKKTTDELGLSKDAVQRIQDAIQKDS